MSWRNSNCVIVVTGKITSNSPKDLSGNRVCVSITVTDKTPSGDYNNYWINCYFNKSYIDKIRELLKSSRIVSITGELSPTTFTHNDPKGIDVFGHTLQIIDKPGTVEKDEKNNTDFDKDIPF
jgi:hypothetical protein